MAQQHALDPRAKKGTHHNNSSRLSFAVHASLLGGFVGLVGLVAIACHHLAH